MNKAGIKLSGIILAAGLVVSGPAAAELGDYGLWTTMKHLFSPPEPDNPVTAEERQAMYPMISNPEGFEDGFSPGRYNKWQTVQLSPETGAVCGNGSPYKFFVNRVPGSSNTVLYYEGGGACWDYESCTGQTGIRGARNPDGIPDDYMALANPRATLASPFIFRLHPWSRVKTQDWNMVYVPYCTGDIYSGDKVAVYEDPTGVNEPLVWHHNGVRNSHAIMTWLKENMQRPGQMLATGCSAGGVGSMTNYHPARLSLAPTKGFLINDSGPIFPAPVGGDPEQYPSVPLQDKIRISWGLEKPLDYISSRLPGLDLDNLGSIYGALSAALPNDRMGHTHFWKDLNYSAYSYERFYPDLENAPDQASLEAGLHARWKTDTQGLINELSGLDNFGYYLPMFRDFNESHCTTILDFANGDIQEQGLELKDFINNVLDGKGAVMQAYETDEQADYDKPTNIIYDSL